MSLRRELAVAFAVQGTGAASVLLATLWLGASFGPELQGGFSQAKAALEFIAALALFGLPQALFYFVKSKALGERAALRWALGSALLAAPIGAAGALLVHPPAAWPVVAALALAVAACVAHGQLRALLLVRERTVWFNLLTALPQGLVLIGVGGLVGIGAPIGIGALIDAAGGPATRPAPAAAWWFLFALAYGVAALIAWRRLRAAGVAGPPASSVGWRELGRYGLAAWLTATLATAAVFVMQAWVEAAAGAAALGRFTLAMTLVQVPLTPIAYAAPLLLRRWMERPGERASRRWAGALFALLLLAAVLVWITAPLWPDLGLGRAYVGATRALAVLLAGAAAEAASRVLTVQASASGLPWVAVGAEAARWGVLALGALLLPRPRGLLPLCAVWAGAAAAAALVFAWQSRVRSHASTAPAAPTGPAR